MEHAPHEPDNRSPSEGTGPADAPSVEAFTLGPFETNCYVVRTATSAACWIVDAGFEPREMIDRVAGQGLRPERVILTHAHVDHIAGLGEVRARWPGVRIVIHPAEREWLTNPDLNLSSLMGMPLVAPAPDAFIDEGDTLELAGTAWHVFHTPGHSPGGITLYNISGKVAIVGDSLFNGSIGRTDFPGSSFDTLAESIRTKLYTLPDDTRVLAGHLPETTIGRERRHNPFVRA